MNVVYCVHDESDYSKHLLPALAALYENNRKNDIQVTVIHLGISWVNEINALASSYQRQLNYIHATDEDISQLRSLPVLGFLNIGANLRFLIFKYFHEPVLYLDVDTLVVSDISGLFSEKSGLILAVLEPSAKLRREKAESLAVMSYFNSGVIRIDAAAYDYDDVMSSVSEILRRYGEKITWGDQDILNILFARDKQLLDGAYNFIPFLSVGEPCIIHYAGRKPWSIRYRFWQPGAQYRTYMGYRDMTPLRDKALSDFNFRRWLQYKFYALFFGYQ